MAVNPSASESTSVASSKSPGSDNSSLSSSVGSDRKARPSPLPQVLFLIIDVADEKREVEADILNKLKQAGVSIEPGEILSLRRLTNTGSQFFAIETDSREHIAGLLNQYLQVESGKTPALKITDQAGFRNILANSPYYRKCRAAIEKKFVARVFSLLLEDKKLNHSNYKVVARCFTARLYYQAQLAKQYSSFCEEGPPREIQKRVFQRINDIETKTIEEGTRVIADANNPLHRDAYEKSKVLSDFIVHLIWDEDEFFNAPITKPPFYYTDEVLMQKDLLIRNLLFNDIIEMFKVEEVLELSEEDHLVLAEYCEPFDSETALTPTEQRFILEETIHQKYNDEKSFLEFLDKLYAMKVKGSLKITEREILRVKAFYDLYHNATVEFRGEPADGEYHKTCLFFDNLFVTTIRKKRYIDKDMKLDDAIVKEEFRRKHMLVKQHMQQKHNIGMASIKPSSDKRSEVSIKSEEQDLKRKAELIDLVDKTFGNFIWRFRGEPRRHIAVVDGALQDLGGYYENPGNLREEQVLEVGNGNPVGVLTAVWCEFQKILANPTLEGAKFFLKQQYRPWYNKCLEVIKKQEAEGFSSKLVALASFDPVPYLFFCTTRGLLTDSDFQQVAFTWVRRLTENPDSVSEAQFRETIKYVSYYLEETVDPEDSRIGQHPHVPYHTILGYRGTAEYLLRAISKLLITPQTTAISESSSLSRNTSRFNKWAQYFANMRDSEQAPQRQIFLKEAYKRGHHIFYPYLLELQRLSASEVKEEQEKRERRAFESAANEMLRYTLEDDTGELNAIRNALSTQKDLESTYPGHLKLLEDKLLERMAHIWQAKITSLFGISVADCPIVTQPEGLFLKTPIKCRRMDEETTIRAASVSEAYHSVNEHARVSFSFNPTINPSTGVPDAIQPIALFEWEVNFKDYLEGEGNLLSIKEKLTKFDAAYKEEFLSRFKEALTAEIRCFAKENGIDNFPVDSAHLLRDGEDSVDSSITLLFNNNNEDNKDDKKVRLPQLLLKAMEDALRENRIRHKMRISPPTHDPYAEIFIETDAKKHPGLINIMSSSVEPEEIIEKIMVSVRANFEKSKESLAEDKKEREEKIKADKPQDVEPNEVKSEEEGKEIKEEGELAERAQQLQLRAEAGREAAAMQAQVGLARAEQARESENASGSPIAESGNLALRQEYSPEYIASMKDLYQKALDRPDRTRAHYFLKLQDKSWYDEFIEEARQQDGFSSKLLALAHFDPVPYLSFCTTRGLLRDSDLQKVAYTWVKRLTEEPDTVSEEQFHETIKYVVSSLLAARLPLLSYPLYRGTQEYLLRAIAKLLTFPKTNEANQAQDKLRLRKTIQLFAKSSQTDASFGGSFLSLAYMRGYQFLQGWLRNIEDLSESETKGAQEKGTLAFQNAVNGIFQAVLKRNSATSSSLTTIRSMIRNQRDLESDYPRHLQLLDNKLSEQIAHIWREKMASVLKVPIETGSIVKTGDQLSIWLPFKNGNHPGGVLTPRERFVVEAYDNMKPKLMRRAPLRVCPMSMVSFEVDFNDYLDSAGQFVPNIGVKLSTFDENYRKAFATHFKKGFEDKIKQFSEGNGIVGFLPESTGTPLEPEFSSELTEEGMLFFNLCKTIDKDGRDNQQCLILRNVILEASGELDIHYVSSGSLGMPERSIWVSFDDVSNAEPDEMLDKIMASIQRQWKIAQEKLSRERKEREEKAKNEETEINLSDFWAMVSGDFRTDNPNQAGVAPGVLSGSSTSSSANSSPALLTQFNASGASSSSNAAASSNSANSSANPPLPNPSP